MGPRDGAHAVCQAQGQPLVTFDNLHRVSSSVRTLRCFARRGGIARAWVRESRERSREVHPMTSNDTEQTTRSPYSAYLGSPDTHIGATQPIALRKGLLDGISVAQIIAAAAAAVTSMLLSSKIGIAGSVIGAAVSSVVTVVVLPALSQRTRHECAKAQGKTSDASLPSARARPRYARRLRDQRRLVNDEHEPRSGVRRHPHPAYPHRAYQAAGKGSRRAKRVQAKGDLCINSHCRSGRRDQRRRRHARHRGRGPGHEDAIRVRCLNVHRSAADKSRG